MKIHLNLLNRVRVEYSRLFFSGHSVESLVRGTRGAQKLHVKVNSHKARAQNASLLMTDGHTVFKVDCSRHKVYHLSRTCIINMLYLLTYAC